jgi:phage baseplate assembly protein W
MSTTTDIKYADWTQSYETPGLIVQGINAINQCLLMICTTEKGSDPLRPEFGINYMSYLDRPINQVFTELTVEIAAQIKAWEPRVTLVKVVPDMTESVNGKISFNIQWKLNGTIETTKVIYG